MKVIFALLISLFLVSTCLGFAPRNIMRSAIKMRTSSCLSMSDESNESPVEEASDFEPEQSADELNFAMNERVRLGRSRDQDGKSNIWSIEPRMQVEETDEEGGGAKKNLVIAGLVIGTALVSLPLFKVFSSYMPDPSDF